MMRNRVAICSLLAILAASHGAARADGAAPAPGDAPASDEASDDAPPAPGGNRPWEQGVTEEQRAAALALFRDANSLFTQSEYAKAAEKYREALQHWDHPRIRGNLATALIYLDTPLEAYEQLEKALAYGATPFEEHVYQQLLTQRKLLLGQLARVVVNCEAQGAAVSVDGNDLFVGPGSRSILMPSGAHQLVARKTKFLTFAQKFTALGGASTTIKVALVPLDQATRYERRWAIWKPWVIAGAGAVIAGIGLPLRSAALSARDEYEREIARSCPTGCQPDAISPAVSDLVGRAHLYNRLEIGAYVAGGAVVASGLVLAYLNRERRVEVNESGARVVVVPTASHAGLSLALGGRW